MRMTCTVTIDWHEGMDAPETTTTPWVIANPGDMPQLVLPDCGDPMPEIVLPDCGDPMPQIMR